jgi:hypothetical protein
VVVEKLVRSPVDNERIRDSRWNSLCRCLHINLSFVRNCQVLGSDGVVVMVVVVMTGESPAVFSQMEKSGTVAEIFIPSHFQETPSDLPRQINITKSTPSTTQLKLFREHNCTRLTCLISPSRARQGILDKSTSCQQPALKSRSDRGLETKASA